MTSIQAVTVIEWYDGIVSGVVRTGDVQQLSLIMLIAWSPTKRLRAYGGIAISDSEHTDLQTVGETETASYIRALMWERQKAQEDAQLLITKDTREILEVGTIPFRDLIANARFDIAIVPNADVDLDARAYFKHWWTTLV